MKAVWNFVEADEEKHMFPLLVTPISRHSALHGNSNKKVTCRYVFVSHLFHSGLCWMEKHLKYLFNNFINFCPEISCTVEHLKTQQLKVIQHHDFPHSFHFRYSEAQFDIYYLFYCGCLKLPLVSEDRTFSLQTMMVITSYFFDVKI